MNSSIIPPVLIAAVVFINAVGVFAYYRITRRPTIIAVGLARTYFGLVFLWDATGLLTPESRTILIDSAKFGEAIAEIVHFAFFYYSIRRMNRATLDEFLRVVRLA